MKNKNIFEKNAKIPDIVQQKANEAFRAIYNRQDEPEEKPQKTYRSARATIIKIATTVAVAAITVAIFFAAIANSGAQGPKTLGGNRFTIKVCAAELEPKASLPISMDVSNQTYGNYIDNTGCANYQINFPISVEGENISTVTFKAGNAVFEVVSINCPSIVKSGSSKKLEGFNSTYVDGHDMSGTPIGKTIVGYYDSFSADYDTLQKSKYLLNVCNVLTDRMDLYYLLTFDGSDDDSCAAYTYLLKDAKITVEVTFNDGTTSSRTLGLFAKVILGTDKMPDGREFTYNEMQIFCYDENDADDDTKQLISSQLDRAAEIIKAKGTNNTGSDATTDYEPVDETEPSVSTESSSSTETSAAPETSAITETSESAETSVSSETSESAETTAGTKEPENTDEVSSTESTESGSSDN